MRDAEINGAASTFFNHSLSLVLYRLSSIANLQTPQLVKEEPKENKFTALKEFIETRLDQDLKVSELAKTVALNPRTLTRRFKQETSYTPYAYITVRRMERAKSLLKSGLSVTSTATTVSYANPAKFAAAFRRCVGCSPSEWQRDN